MTKDSASQFGAGYKQLTPANLISLFDLDRQTDEIRYLSYLIIQTDTRQGPIVGHVLQLYGSADRAES